MKINKHTKIKAFITKESIESIQHINSSFKKLDTWTIEKYASSGVDVKDLAKAGGILSNNFLTHLKKLGFEVEYDSDNAQQTGIKEKIKLDKLKIVPLDVRPTIAAGNDPFSEIMQAISLLQEDETLQIINIFVPFPLINVLEGRGFKSWTNTISDKEHHTFFTKANTATSPVVEKKETSEGDFDTKLASFGDKVKEIDVRHLEMPEPMVTILEKLETLPENHVLLVNHKKVPQFLLPELKSRNYQWMYKEIEVGHLLFIVFK